MDNDKSSTNLSITIGGRVVKPHFPIVDASFSTSQKEKTFQSRLMNYTSKHIPLESKAGIERRERVLSRMKVLARSWIQSVCRKKQLPAQAIAAAGGQLFTSGSYRLDIQEPGADIDTILVTPSYCDKSDFFGSGYLPPNYDGEMDLTHVRDPDSLAERIRRHPDVTNFVPVENAAVPILTFDWEGVNIDLLFACLNRASVDESFDIDQDSVLDGVDSATEKSLNGPRVTNLIAALVSGTPERYKTFLTVVRCVRKWAKARGLYSNKSGYWGGVNINIGVAFVLQLYPNNCPATLLRKFFLVFKTWKFPKPIMLTTPHDAQLGLTVWNEMHVKNMRQVAPMITPAYPAMNSTLSISRRTLQIMNEEMNRAFNILNTLWKEHDKFPDRDPLGDEFGELFQPSDFFIAYPHYLSICIVGPNEADAQSWAGFVESRLRKLVSDLLGKSLPLSKIQLWPKKFEACVAEKTALLSPAQRRNSITYFVGLMVDTFRMRGTQLNMEQQLQNFREWELKRFQPHLNGMDVLVKHFPVKMLPKMCFVDIYEGGKLVAMKKRRRIRDADPKRQNAKRMARLAALEAEMAEKKDLMAAAAERKKRKREDSLDESGDQDEIPIKVEAADSSSTTSALTAKIDVQDLMEEEVVLENVLDQVQENTTESGSHNKDDAAIQMHGIEEGDDYNASDDEDGTGYGPHDSRIFSKSGDNSLVMGIAEKEAEILRKSGYTIISDDEKVSIGGNRVLPWRRERVAEGDNKNEMVKKIPITFRTEFDVVELDSHGYVVDKGDDDFKPSLTWTGRLPGFEFKLGERGLGYYRTGKKVVVPSNIEY